MNTKIGKLISSNFHEAPITFDDNGLVIDKYEVEKTYYTEDSYNIKKANVFDKNNQGKVLDELFSHNPLSKRLGISISAACEKYLVGRMSVLVVEYNENEEIINFIFALDVTLVKRNNVDYTDLFPSYYTGKDNIKNFVEFMEQKVGDCFTNFMVFSNLDTMQLVDSQIFDAFQRGNPHYNMIIPSDNPPSREAVDEYNARHLYINDEEDPHQFNGLYISQRKMNRRGVLRSIEKDETDIYFSFYKRYNELLVCYMDNSNLDGKHLIFPKGFDFVHPEEKIAEIKLKGYTTVKDRLGNILPYFIARPDAECVAEIYYGVHFKEFFTLEQKIDTFKCHEAMYMFKPNDILDNDKVSMFTDLQARHVYNHDGSWFVSLVSKFKEYNRCDIAEDFLEKYEEASGEEVEEAEDQFNFFNFISDYVENTEEKNDFVNMLKGYVDNPNKRFALYVNEYIHSDKPIYSEKLDPILKDFIYDSYEESPEIFQDIVSENIQGMLFYAKDLAGLYYYGSGNNFEFYGGDNVDFENEMVSDIYSCIPVRYEDAETILKNRAKDNNFIANNIVTGLMFQEVFEFGNSKSGDRRFKGRIERIDLGSVYVEVVEEIHYNYYYKVSTQPICDNPVPVRLLLSMDLETHTAVLFLCMFSHTHRASKILDMISRNELPVIVTPEVEQLVGEYNIDSRVDLVHVKEAFIDTDNTISERDKPVRILSLYDYLKYKFRITKVGTPRNLVLSPYLTDSEHPIHLEDDEYPEDPKEKEELEEKVDLYYHYAASLLHAETFFEDMEELGKLTAYEFEDVLTKELGDAVYDYSSEYVSKSVVLECGDTYKDYCVERIDFAVVALYYIELLVIEDAAVGNCDTGISDFINNYYERNLTFGQKVKRKFVGFTSSEVLGQIDDLVFEYAKTIDFWNPQLNYSSSMVRLEMMRERFKISEDVELLDRDREEITSIYESKKSGISKILGFFVGFFAVFSTVQGVYEMYSGAVETGELDFLGWLVAFYQQHSIIFVFNILIILFILYYIIVAIHGVTCKKRYERIVHGLTRNKKRR